MRVQKSAAIGGKKAGQRLLGVIKIECIVIMVNFTDMDSKESVGVEEVKE